MFSIPVVLFGRGILQNAERRMMVSSIECETGKCIIYDKLISYMPNPNPNPKVKGKVRVRVRVRVRHV